MATDYYGVLGLARGASDNEIKKAYRRLARDLHPDVNPDPGAKERFQEVSRAYQALTDPEKRRIVDLGGDPFDNGAGAGAGGFGPGFGGLGDIMDAFFGGAATRGPRSRVRAGRDAMIPIELDLDETVFGVTK
ncbi:MAG TPA: DnaJ domain-containing protein, partial [Nocardioides sp.]|nr:DnaJ domain-containing protein [Nocardioides sp.]